jgi:N-acetylglucosamine-6-sulfatase
VSRPAGGGATGRRPDGRNKSGFPRLVPGPFDAAVARPPVEPAIPGESGKRMSTASTALGQALRVFAAAVLAGVFGGCAARSAARPNVVVILTDDQRHDAMSCAGHPFLKTPSLDRLAAEGASFVNAFVTTSLCSPSRASLLSGLYAHAHKVLNNFTDFPADLPNYPRQLHESGYETAYIGKWHMGEDDDRPRPGFDFWMSHRGQGNYFDNEFNINGRREVIKGYYTGVVTDRAVEWIRRKHDKPFLFVLGHKAPHGGPIVPEPKYEHAFDDQPVARPATAEVGPDKPEWLTLSVPTWHGIGGPLYGLKDFGRFVRSYLATLVSVDESVGRIYEALRESGRLDDTIVIFTSDNGFALGDHARVDKRTMYEESIRVPLVVRYPPMIAPGTLVREMVLNLDLAPSILDVCGAEPLPNIHGVSWKPLLSGDTSKRRRSFLYEYNYEAQFPYTPNVRGVRTDEWKFIHYPRGDGGADAYKAELYNLKDDPLETRNLIDDPKLADRVAELRAELERLLRESGGLPDVMPRDEGIRNVPPKY